MNHAEIFQLASQMLNSRLEFHQIRQSEFLGGFQSKDEVVPSCRFILVAEGSMIYQTDAGIETYEAGTILFVPPWIWRQWQVASGTRVQLLWTVFTAAPGLFSSKRAVLSATPTDFQLIHDTMKRIYELRTHRPQNDLLIESEMKAALTRFFYSLPAQETASATVSHYHPDVQHAIDWLHAHYTEANALSLLQNETSLNPDYFRDLFRRQTHQNPSQFLNTLRLKAARYFLRETSKQIQQIATDLGFADPLYFSRAYRKFWGRSPSQERKE